MVEVEEPSGKVAVVLVLVVISKTKTDLSMIVLNYQ
jgi:hypothetical protein